LRNEWATESARLTDAASVDRLLLLFEDKIYDETVATPLVDYADAYFDSGEAAKDGSAFLSYMSGVNEVSPTIYGNLDALTSANYYKGDTATSLVNNYISSATVLGGYSGSAVVVLYDGISAYSYPMDFSE